MREYTLEELMQQGGRPVSAAPDDGYTLEELQAMSHPPPERLERPMEMEYGQLRGGADPLFPPGMPMAGLSGNVGQELLNMFLPENLSGPIIENMAPGRSLETGPDGTNFIAEPLPSGLAGPPEPLALNQPGVGSQDAINLAGTAGAAATGFGLLTKAPSIGSAILHLAKTNPKIASATGATIFNSLQQLLGLSMQPEDSEESFDPRTTGMDAAAAAVLPAILQPLVPGWRRVMANFNKSKWATPEGTLSSDAKRSLEAAGIKHENLSKQDILELNNAVARSASYSDEARGRRAFLDLHDIDATKGMISQRDSVITSEMGYGARRDWSDAAEGLRKAGDKMFPPSDPTRFSRDVNTRFGADKDKATDLYTIARRTSEGVTIPGDVNRTIKENIRNRMDEKMWSREVKPLLDTFPTTKPQDTITLLGPDGKPIREVVLDSAESPNTFRDLFEWRRSVDDPSGIAVKAFDKEMDRMLTETLSNPMSQDAILAWKQANQNYRNFAVQWKSGDLVEKLITRDKQNVNLKHAPEDTWNLLFNASEAGFVTKPGLKQSVRKLSEVFGKGSSEMEAFRNALGRRMVRSRSLVHPSNTTRGREFLEVTAKPMSKQWQAMKEEWGDLLHEVYPAEVLDKMDNFVTMAQWLDPKGGTTPGNAYETLFAFMQRGADATFRFTRSGLRQGAELIRGQGIRATETSLNGPVKRGGGLWSGATLGEGNKIIWDEIMREVLEEQGYTHPEWMQ